MSKGNKGSETYPVHLSSLVDLKAELIKKQDQFRKEKALRDAGLPVYRENTNKKKNSFGKQFNRGVEERNARDVEALIEENKTIQKSQKILEQKVKLYDQLSKGDHVPDEDGSKTFLVDFERKAIDKVFAKRAQERALQDDIKKKRTEEKTEDEMNNSSSGLNDTAKSPDDEWLDYVDSFGRSRRCMRKDLPEKERHRIEMNSKSTIGLTKLNATNELMSEDMRRELQRQKWEEDANVEGPLHFENVRFDEARQLGVGYYQFSKDEETRKAQIDTLKSIREKTLENRGKKERLLAKRKAAMKARLEKVKQRRLVQKGGVLPDEDDEDSDDDDDVIGPSKPELLKRDEELVKSATPREWDKDKVLLDINPGSKKVEEDYFEKRRQERDEKFAPPRALYDTPVSNNTMDRKKAFGSCSDNSETNTSSIQDMVSAGISAFRATFESAPEAQPYPPNDVKEVSHDNSVSLESIPLPEQSSDKRESSWENINFTDNYSSSPMNNAQNPFVHNEVKTPEVKLSEWYGYGTEGEHRITPNYSYSNVHITNTVENTSMPSQENKTLPDSQDGQLTNMQTTANKSLKCAPQPAHYSSKPVMASELKGEIKQPKYHHVPVHQLPSMLPAPPIMGTNVLYPSMESTRVGSKKENNSEKQWLNQYRYKSESKEGSNTIAPIPFPAPLIQRKEDCKVLEEPVFDPSKPPPKT